MKKLLTFIKEKYLYILGILFLIIINTFAINKFAYEQGNKFGSLYIVYILFTILIQIIMLFYLYYTIKKDISLEKKFLMIAIPLGIIYMILIPVGRANDEQNHFWRAYEISQGHLLSEKNSDGIGGREYSSELVDFFLPKDGIVDYKDELNSLKVKKDGTTRYTMFPNMSLYSPVSYIPQSLGILLGRILHFPTLLIAYCGRMFNFIFWLLITYFAIKIVPFKKTTILAISLIPVSMQSAASLSADALINAIAIFFISLIMYLKYTKKDFLNKKDYLMLIASLVIISLSKIVYVPLCLLLFLIPKERFKNSKQKKVIIIGMILGVIITNLIWLKISSSYLIEIRAGVNSKEQVKNVLSHPINYMIVFANSILEGFQSYIYSAFGGELAYQTVRLSTLYTYIYLIIFILLVIFDSNKKQQDIDRILMALIDVIIIALIFTSLYVQWTPLKSKLIEGVQGRYFIPILLSIAMLFKSNNEYKIIKSHYCIFMFILLINMCALAGLFYFYI